MEMENFVLKYFKRNGNKLCKCMLMYLYSCCCFVIEIEERVIMIND